MRSDKGHYQLTPRDLNIMRFIGQQRVVRLDQFQVLMTRYSEYQFDDGLIGYSTMMDRVYKLQRAGYIHYAKILAHGPGWIWLTRRGLDATDLPFSAKPPHWRELPHLYAINQVRMLTTWQYWRAERFIRHVKQQGAIPDALIWESEEAFKKDKPIAVEVEISLKRVALREKKLKELVDIFYGYNHIQMYVPNDGLLRAMDRARAKLGDRQDRVELIVLPQIDPGIPDYF